MDDVGVFFQQGLDDLSLNADPPAVDDSNLAESPLNCLVQVFLDDNPDFPRLERVEIDRVLNRDLVHRSSIMSGYEVLSPDVRLPDECGGFEGNGSPPGGQGTGRD